MTKSVASNGHAGNHQRGKHKPQPLLSTEKPFAESRYNMGHWHTVQGPGLCAWDGRAFLGGRRIAVSLSGRLLFHYHHPARQQLTKFGVQIRNSGGTTAFR